VTQARAPRACLSGMIRKLFAVAVAATCVLSAPSAFADDTYTETRTGTNQNVVFKDDVLDAHQFGGNDIRIRVMPSPKRVMLLRPRTQFVTEMLKSVEAL
jgi:hypothetical protein